MPRDQDYYTRMQAQYDIMMRQIREEHYRQLVYSQTAIRYMTREEAEQVYPRLNEVTAGNTEMPAGLIDNDSAPQEPEYRFDGQVRPIRVSSWVTYGEFRAAYYGETAKPRKKKRSHLPKWW